MRQLAPLPAVGWVATSAAPADAASTGVVSSCAGVAGAGTACAGAANVGGFRSASKCQGSWCLHSARSRYAQQLIVVRRQQILQLCEIIRMSADVVGGIMCFELFFEGILENWWLAGTACPWGSDRVPTGTLKMLAYTYAIVLKETAFHLVQDCSVGEGTSQLASVATFLDLVPVNLQRSLVAWALGKA